ncbi:hypothetical protein J3458_020596 [Metarhizium acridum]|uniref:uncharacterized protein n=1 Tax=Metarhizium acridum TaxID=92637 RepID=UPI001C6AB625|nr:hypothetical protein J3458_020596 [Metarhizium acridum]
MVSPTAAVAAEHQAPLTRKSVVTSYFVPGIKEPFRCEIVLPERVARVAQLWRQNRGVEFFMGHCIGIIHEEEAVVARSRAQWCAICICSRGFGSPAMILSLPCDALQ